MEDHGKDRVQDDDREAINGNAVFQGYQSYRTRGLDASRTRNFFSLSGRAVPDEMAFVDRIDDASRFQYTIGYYPTESVMDGKYRRIQVRVSRPGLRVLYRHGYFARQFQAGFDRLRMMAYSRITAAASYGMDVRDLAVVIEASSGKAPDGSREVTVHAQIAPERLSLTEVNGRKKGSLEIAAGILPSHRRIREVIQFPPARDRSTNSGIKLFLFLDHWRGLI